MPSDPQPSTFHEGIFQGDVSSMAKWRERERERGASSIPLPLCCHQRRFVARVGKGEGRTVENGGGRGGGGTTVSSRVWRREIEGGGMRKGFLSVQKQQTSNSFHLPREPRHSPTGQEQLITNAHSCVFCNERR